jgi:prepilin-type N-terminal cleavage/methylation domain-containing protein
MNGPVPNLPVARRRGFTLIEMLVVMTIIVVIATIAVLVAPRFSEAQRTSLAAGQLQGWLFTAKQRAYRDRVVNGLRPVTFITQSNGAAGPGTATVTPVTMGSSGAIPDGIHVGSVLLVDPGTNQEVVSVTSSPSPTTFTATFAKSHAAGFLIIDAYVKAFAYVEQPADFAVGSINQAGVIGTTYVVQFNLPPNPGPPVSNYDLRNEIQAGDLLVVRGTEVHLISSVGAPPPIPPPAMPPTLPYVTLATPLAADIPPNSAVPYRIIRTARPLTSEPPLQLPQDTAVNLALSVVGPPPFDVLFTPAGGLQGPGSQGKIIWWVHDTVKLPFEGGPTLITVYGRAGAIAAHPVNADPAGNVYPGGAYFFTQDGRNSGM